MCERSLHYLKQAIELGELSKHRTADNPWVGCVIVQDGVVIGQGSRGVLGEPHAEAAAISVAEKLVIHSGGLLCFVRLNPAPFMAVRRPVRKRWWKKVSRVAVGIRDPHIPA
jgi:diaminohydroxyphosphoribosylaminopyrimidine deaminase/5-amino-6-(5-phosphoribosylamino)uracil reductase